MLLIPEDSRKRLLDVLRQVRENTGHEYPVGIKNVKNSTGRIFFCAQSWLLLAIGFMRTKQGKTPYQVHYGKTEKGHLLYSSLTETLGLKFILFREKDNHQKMQLLDRYAQCVETTFRMGLKGGLHYLSTDKNPIHITALHFDGNEHHDSGIDKERVIGRLKGLKACCSVLDAEDVIDDRSGNHTRTDAQHYDDCQLLQLTDLLVGSFRTFLGECTRPVHKTLCYSARLPIEAFSRNRAGFLKSRWYGAISMSQCELCDRGWQYSTVELIKYGQSDQLGFEWN
jgi:hypothetical protein